MTFFLCGPIAAGASCPTGGTEHRGGQSLTGGRAHPDGTGDVELDVNTAGESARPGPVLLPGLLAG